MKVKGRYAGKCESMVMKNAALNFNGILQLAIKSKGINHSQTNRSNLTFTFRSTPTPFMCKNIY